MKSPVLAVFLFSGCYCGTCTQRKFPGFRQGDGLPQDHDRRHGVVTLMAPRRLRPECVFRDDYRLRPRFERRVGARGDGNGDQRRNRNDNADANDLGRHLPF